MLNALFALDQKAPLIPKLTDSQLGVVSPLRGHIEMVQMFLVDTMTRRDTVI